MLEQATEIFYQDPIGHTAAAAQLAAAQALEAYDARNQHARDLEAAQNNDLRSDYAESQVRARFSDWDRYAEQTARIILENPAQFPEEMFRSATGMMQAMEMGYRLAKSVDGEASAGRRFDEIMSAGSKSFRDILDGR